MTESTAIMALHRALSEARDAKRRVEAEILELENKLKSLRSQSNSLSLFIEQTEEALRRELLPSEIRSEPAVPSKGQAEPLPRAVREAPDYFQGVEIEAEVASHRRSEQSSNVRFNDFRIPQAATIVLREAGSPLHVSEIYRRMAEGGFEFRGQHQLITLAVSLSRSKRFRKVAPGTFELAPEYEAGRVA